MIIGITGKKQHGKDTLARMLMEYKITKRLYMKVGFADPLRSIGKILGFSNQMMYENKDEIHPLWARSWRQTAQFIGTDLLRDQFDPATWTKLAYQQIKDNPEISFIFTDVRYDDEAEFIKEQGGIIFKIIRSGMPDVDTHKSEKGIHPKYVLDIIKNDGTLIQLGYRAREIARIYEV